MPTEDALLRAIIADPEDDAPRLSYAGWLDELGHCIRAEFIRLQCALARMGDDDEQRPAFKAREKQLLSRQQAEWQQRLGKYGVTEATLHHGFPEQVTLRADDFIRNMGRVLRAAPVRGARILDCSDVAALAASPHLAKLTSLNLLNLTYNGIGPDGVRTLAASPHLSNLTSLDLAYNGIRDAGVRALAASPHLSNLVSLNLKFNDIGTAGARALAASQHLGRLTHLNLLYNAIGAAGAQALANPSNGLPALTEVTFDRNRIGSAVLQEVEMKLQARRQRRDSQSRRSTAKG